MEEARPGRRGLADVLVLRIQLREQFPYTPNIRGDRTDDWKYIHYPHGDGKPDRHMAELYNMKADPEETRNLINDKAQAGRVKELQACPVFASSSCYNPRGGEFVRSPGKLRRGRSCHYGTTFIRRC